MIKFKLKIYENLILSICLFLLFSSLGCMSKHSSNYEDMPDNLHPMQETEAQKPIPTTLEEHLLDMEGDWIKIGNFDKEALFGPSNTQDYQLAIRSGKIYFVRAESYLPNSLIFFPIEKPQEQAVGMQL